MTVRVASAAIFLVALGLAGPARADLQGRDEASTQAVESLEAYAAYKMGQYDLARERWEALAAKGNTTAMINLANLHAQGQGVPRDPAMAARWLGRAAEQGNGEAQFSLGVLLATGLGKGAAVAPVEQKQAGIGWLSKAADGGHAEAAAMLKALR